LTCKFGYSQNLVQNGSFEQFSVCPNSFGQITSSSFWFSPSLGTPDYYNQCAAPVSGIDVPDNWGGFQQAHIGVAYAGISLYYDNWVDCREYMEIELSSPLVANSCYYFEMYANLPDTCRYTTPTIGVYFSNSIISGIGNNSNLSFIPQLNNTTANLIDSANWTLISGTYTALGGERYITIGNFYDDGGTVAILVNSTTNHHDSYCYIDDVSLSLCTGINDLNQNVSVNIYPNPFSDELMIENTDGDLLEIILYDIASRKLLRQSFTSSTSINTEQLSKGIYLYEVRNRNGLCKKGKVVKN